jgi:hypothetical protein
MNKVISVSGYGKYLNHSEDKPKGEIAGKGVEVIQSSRNWRVLTVVSVVALSALALIAYRNMAPPLKMIDPLIGPHRPEKLYSALLPLCKKAVEERCTEDGPDGVLCLKDFLDKDWKPTVFGIESSSSDPLCFPPVSKKLKEYVSYFGGPSRFVENYGKTCTEISKETYKLPEMQWLNEYFSIGEGCFRKQADKMLICFKSHLS